MKILCQFSEIKKGATFKRGIKHVTKSVECDVGCCAFLEYEDLPMYSVDETFKVDGSPMYCEYRRGVFEGSILVT